MAPSLLLLLLLLSFLLLLLSFPLTLSSSPGNVTVVGTVFCDACSDNTFSKHSYFLQGVKVQVVCKFSSGTAAGEEISINTERTTDRFGGYRFDIPSAGDFECREGRALESFCKASLVQSPSPHCDVPSLSSSAEHFAVKAGGEFNSCVYDLSALSYRPAQRDASFCGSEREEAASLVTVGPSNSNSALFFWPPFFPWPCWPPWPPFPFPNPPSFPFPFPFPNPPSLPFPSPFPYPQIPFFAPPPPPAFPFPFFPPWPFLAPPASGAPPQFPFTFPPLPFFDPKPPPALTLSPPPPAFPFPYMPLPPFYPYPHSPSSPPSPSSP